MNKTIHLISSQPTLHAGTPAEQQSSDDFCLRRHGGCMEGLSVATRHPHGRFVCGDTPPADEKYMAVAIDEARQALRQGEVPVGCVIVAGEKIIGRGHNLTETLADVTAHAEMQALTAAAQTLGGKYLRDATLYVTVEPCIMCAGAIGWAQISRIVYGCADVKKGYTLFAPKALHPRAHVTAGVLEEECKQLMQDFFISIRN